MSPIILTSSSFSNPKIMAKTFALLKKRKAKTVAIITTAAEDKEKNKYAQLTQSQFREKNFKQVDFFDAEFNDPNKLKNYDVIYVCGGNTFYLLYYLKNSGADKVIRDLILEDRIVYFGTSAGSLILSPSIDLAGEIAADPNDIGLKDLTALGLVDFDIFPHYREKYQQEILLYEKKFGRPVVKLADGQAVFLIDGKVEIIS